MTGRSGGLEAKEPLLEVSGLTVHFTSPRGEVKAVEGVDLSLRRGEIVGLAGESGSGKSTLALGLMRLVNPPGRIVGGEVRFEGKDLLGLSEDEVRRAYRWKEIAMVFQGSMNGFTPVFTIGSQIDEILRIHGYRGNRQKRIEELLEMNGLDSGVAERYPHELSGGQKQRAFIAMALALDPKVLIADEPTTALDVITQANILNELKSLRKEKGMSILLITHDLALISEAVDRLYIMYAGRVVEEGRSEDVFGSPKHPYTKALIASTPTLQTSQIAVIPGFMPDLANLQEACSFNPRCPYATEICRRQRPELKMVEGGERVACWLY